MKNTSKKLEKVLYSNNIKNKDKLEKQQAYYKRLTKKGIAKKETYNLKSLSSI